MLVTKNGKQDEKDRRKDRIEQNIINSCWVTAKSLQKINGKKISSSSLIQAVQNSKCFISNISNSTKRQQCCNTMYRNIWGASVQPANDKTSAQIRAVLYHPLAKHWTLQKSFTNNMRNPPPPHTHTFGMEKTSLTRYKIDVSKWNSVHAFYTRQIHTEPISHVLMEKKKRGNQR